VSASNAKALRQGAAVRSVLGNRERGLEEKGPKREMSAPWMNTIGSPAPACRT